MGEIKVEIGVSTKALISGLPNLDREFTDIPARACRLDICAAILHFGFD